MTAAPLRDEAGHLVGAVATAEDVTTWYDLRIERERLLAESQLRAAQLDAVVSFVPHGLVVQGPQGDVRRMNAAAIEDPRLLYPRAAWKVVRRASGQPARRESRRYAVRDDVLPVCPRPRRRRCPRRSGRHSSAGRLRRSGFSSAPRPFSIRKDAPSARSTPSPISPACTTCASSGRSRCTSWRRLLHNSKRRSRL